MKMHVKLNGIMTNDLTKFKKLFGYEVTRESDTTLHYRAKGDLDFTKAVARAVIDKHVLSLKVVSTGNMAQLKAFEVVKE